MQNLTSESEATNERSLAAYAAGVIFALLTVGAIALLFYWLWSVSGRLDATGQRRGLTAALMQRKTASLSEIYSGLMAGDFDRAEQAAARLRRISETSEWYLSDKRYAELTDDFRHALGALDDALSDGDLKQRRSAYNRLARTCVECHRQATNSNIDGVSLQYFTRIVPPAPDMRQAVGILHHRGLQRQRAAR